MPVFIFGLWLAIVWHQSHFLAGLARELSLDHE